MLVKMMYLKILAAPHSIREKNKNGLSSCIEIQITDRLDFVGLWVRLRPSISTFMFHYHS